MTTPPYSTPSSRWHALQNRDPLASKSFIYGVLTTHIYCRPNCPARLARRANIVFFSNSLDAAAAGYRPCKRCRPDSEEEEDRQVKMVERACGLIRGEREGEKWCLRDLAREMGVTESHFCRVFRRVVGVSVGGLRRGVREEEERAGLDASKILSAAGEKDVCFPSSEIFRLEEMPNDLLFESPDSSTSSSFLDFDDYILHQRLETELRFDASDVQVLVINNSLVSKTRDTLAVEDCFQFIDFDSAD